MLYLYAFRLQRAVDNLADFSGGAPALEYAPYDAVHDLVGLCVCNGSFNREDCFAFHDDSAFFWGGWVTAERLKERGSVSVSGSVCAKMCS